MSGLRGHAHQVGDDISTDEILPGRYMAETDREVLAAHALEGADPGLAARVHPGDFLVAGRNFGTGSSRETAPRALLAAGFGGIIADSVARIFFRNCINLGLPVFWVPAARKHFSDGDLVEVEPASGLVRNLQTGFSAQSQELPEFIQAIVSEGGLINYAKGRLGRSLISSDLGDPVVTRPKPPRPVEGNPQQ
ncbi:MAG: LeuD/DmdB family oxidoreductase small subunit [Isosphaeraceae bacterium]